MSKNNYYAVGFGSWSYYGCQHLNEIINPKEQSSNLMISAVHVDGSYAKVRGPFRDAKTAWSAASALQQGASMMAHPPFIFQSNNKFKLSTLENKINSNEYVCVDEYVGDDAVHFLRFVKEPSQSLGFKDKSEEFVFVYHRKRLPASRLARCKIINIHKRNTTITRRCIDTQVL